MSDRKPPWVILLAAGDGNRVRSLTKAGRKSVPKQFFRPTGDQSMFDWTFKRACALTNRERILVVVADQHRELWHPELARLPARNILVQPQNRGTATGILFPLVEVLGRDEEATVVLLPCDHYVEKESVLFAAIGRALATIERSGSDVVLLGMTPDGKDDEGYGWIVPSRRSSESLGMPVLCFVEKPSPEQLSDLRRQGALLSSFILAARARSLFALFVDHLPQLVRDFPISTDSRDRSETGSHQARLDAFYASSPSHDFSREILQASARRLTVLPVLPCGWSDLGTVARLSTFLEPMEAAASSPFVDHHLRSFPPGHWFG